MTPSEVSSGEAVTAAHMAADLVRSGAETRFLASPFTAQLASTLGPAYELGRDMTDNQRAWDRAVDEFSPDAIVFADYPLLFFANGSVPLVDEGWLSRLERAAPLLVTLDHLGYAQGPKTVFFGPPHLSFHAATFPAVPDRMQLLLPCPSHDPRQTGRMRGMPFRYWSPSGREDRGGRAAVRQRHGVGEGELLVVHAAPQWAWRMAEQLGLPYYRFLPSILAHYFDDLPVPLTVVSVNNGGLLPSVEGRAVRVLNVSSLPIPDYERLLLASDLLLSENGISVSMGKAVCAGVPCALLRNSFRLSELVERAGEAVRRIVLAMEDLRLGSVFPYEVFPLWRRDEVPLPGPVPGCTAVEVFGGEPTRQLLHRLLLDEASGAELKAEAKGYAERVAALPGPVAALRSALALVSA